MSNSTIIYTSDFGERVIVRRVFIPAVISKESLLLLCEMLNTNLTLGKKNISSYASGQLSYRCYYYRGGYVLEGRLSQVEAKGLSYAFVDPYQKALAILSDFSDEKIDMDEKTFSLCKERIFAHENLNHMDAIHAMLCLDGSVLTADKEKLLSLTKQEVLKALAEVRNSDVGDMLYFGPKSKKNPFYDLKEFAKPLFSIQNEDTIEYRDYRSYRFVKESRVFVFSLKEELHDYNTYLKTWQALRLYTSALEKKLSESFGSKINFDSGLMDNKTVYIIASVSKGKMDILLPKLDAALSHLPFTEAYEDGQVLYHEDELLKCIYADKAVDCALKLMSLNIDLPEEYLSLKENEKEEVIAVAKGLTLKTSMTLLGAEKKEEIL